ncbi:nuclear transport factor 2 family protein [Streptomyces sp. NPDC048419]|uniref:nuclear transport factor 2 family protein n=1 Tax=Streptomyces sp. NPDC048419 TaxID=3365547 RepID=UPI0037130ECC
MPNTYASTIGRLWTSYNQRDWEEMKSLLADDFHFFDNATGISCTRDEWLERIIEYWAGALPDSAVSDLQVVSADGVATAVYELSGTNTGYEMLPGLGTTNKRAALRMCSIFQFTESGTISSLEGFYDMLSVIRPLASDDAIRVSLPFEVQSRPRVGVVYPEGSHVALKVA